MKDPNRYSQCDLLFGFPNKFTLENSGGDIDGHRRIGECAIEEYLEERGEEREMCPNRPKNLTRGLC